MTFPILVLLSLTDAGGKWPSCDHFQKGEWVEHLEENGKLGNVSTDIGTSIKVTWDKPEEQESWFSKSSCPLKKAGGVPRSNPSAAGGGVPRSNPSTAGGGVPRSNPSTAGGGVPRFNRYPARGSDEWTEYQDENGTPYYHNSRTDVSQWEYPEQLSSGVPRSNPSPAGVTDILEDCARHTHTLGCHEKWMTEYCAKSCATVPVSPTTSNNGPQSTVGGSVREGDWPKPVNGDRDGTPHNNNPQKDLVNVPTGCGTPGQIPRSSYRRDSKCIKNGPRGNPFGKCSDCKQQTLDSHWVYPFLDEINIRRCMHNAPPVRWNKKLECWAANWVTNYKNNQLRPHSCAMLSDMGTQEVCAQGNDTARSAVYGWYKEVLDCYPGGIFKPKALLVRGFGQPPTMGRNPCAHALSLLWKYHTHVGCHKQGGKTPRNQPATCEFVTSEIPRGKWFKGTHKLIALQTVGNQSNPREWESDPREWETSLQWNKDLVEVVPIRTERECNNDQWKNYQYDELKPRSDMFE